MDRPRPSVRKPMRRGVTLAEVLVSMLVMSVGVVSLAALFPISVLRTAQATQLTHAVFLRSNAEAALESPFGILNSYDSYTGVNPNIVPVNGTAIPTLAVVDPLGVNTPATGLNTAQFAGLNSIVRTGGWTTSVAGARTLAALPDSWGLLFEDVVVSYQASPLQITTNTSAAANGVTPNAANLSYRVVLFDSTGKFAQINPISTSSGTGTTLTLAGAGLPVGFVPARVRVEKQEFRYSNILTVRKKSLPTTSGDASWVADVDVAVFFNRSLSPNDESLFTLTIPTYGFDGAPGVAGVDDDGNGVIDYANGGAADPNEVGFPGSDDLRTVGFTGAPNLKKGSYMLETSMLQWYRIVDFNATKGVILLDQTVRSSPLVTTLNGVFMKGIVEVFPLGNRTGQQ